VKLAFALLLANCTEQQIRVATVVDSALIACDVGQTYHESDGGRWDRPGAYPGTVRLEENPVLGPRPSPGLLAAGALFGIYATSIIGFSKMPTWARVGYLATIGAVESYIIAEHYSWDGVCGAR
jgi:hypothetical protein